MIVCERFNEFQVLVHWRKIYCFKIWLTIWGFNCLLAKFAGFMISKLKKLTRLFVILHNLNFKNQNRMEQNIQFCLVRMRKKMQSSPVTVDVNQLLVYLEHWLTWNSNLCKSQAEGCWNSYDLARQNLFLWHVKIRYRAKNWNLN